MLVQQFIHNCNGSDFVSPLDPFEDVTFILHFEPRLMRVFNGACSFLRTRRGFSGRRHSGDRGWC
jgi:hypothetical protein